MIDKKELCEKITAIYPDIGVCGIDIDVVYDEGKEAWMVDLKKSMLPIMHSGQYILMRVNMS